MKQFPMLFGYIGHLVDVGDPFFINPLCDLLGGESGHSPLACEVSELL